MLGNMVFEKDKLNGPCNRPLLSIRYQYRGNTLSLPTMSSPVTSALFPWCHFLPMPLPFSEETWRTSQLSSFCRIRHDWELSHKLGYWDGSKTETPAASPTNDIRFPFWKSVASSLARPKSQPRTSRNFIFMTRQPHNISLHTHHYEVMEVRTYTPIIEILTDKQCAGHKFGSIFRSNVALPSPYCSLRERSSRSLSIFQDDTHFCCQNCK